MGSPTRTFSLPATLREISRLKQAATDAVADLDSPVAGWPGFMRKRAGHRSVRPRRS